MEDKKTKVSAEEMAEAAKRAAAAKKAPAKKAAPKKTAPKKEAPTRSVDDEEEEQAEAEDVEEAVEEKAEKVKKPKLEKRISDDEKKSVKGLRTAAIILWILAVAAEVGAFFAFSYAMRNNAFAAGFDLSRPEVLLLCGALLLDAVLCIVAAQLWKKSNAISPCLADSKLVRTLWHQLGVIMVLVCFLPIGIFLLLKTDKLDKKTRTILLAAVLALFVGATASSVDYQQPNDEEVAQLQEEAKAEVGDGSVYWTRFGKSYHFDRNCRFIADKADEPDGNVFSGSLDDAFAANRWDPCDTCAGGAEAKLAEGGETADEAVQPAA